MKVKYLGYIRDYTDIEEEIIENCETIKDLINAICVRYGKKFSDNVMNGEKLSGKIIIFVNGKGIYNLDGINTYLNENDEITILPVLAGG